MIEFYIVSKCPMEGLYKNEKLARQVSASYKDAVVCNTVRNHVSTVCRLIRIQRGKERDTGNGG